MPEPFKIKDFNKNFKKIKKEIPEDFHVLLENINKQVIELNKNYNNRKEIVIKQKSEINKKDKLLSQLQNKEKELNEAIKNKEELIDNLNVDIQKYKSEIIKKEKSISELQNNKKELSEAVKSNELNLSKLNNDIKAYKLEIAKLTSEYNKKNELYEGIKSQRIRPVATPTQISSSFKSAFEAMRKELQTPDESPIDYVISKFDISLKTGIGVDDKDNISFQLPKEDEISKPENLSIIEFSIRSVPKT